MASYSANKDSFITENGAGNNYGSNSNLQVQASSNDRKRTVVNFDLSGVSQIQLAKLKLYYYNDIQDDPAGYDIRVSKLTRGFVEDEATWLEYSTGNSWTSSGGDYTDTDSIVDTVPSSFGWMTWDITALAQDAINNEAGSLNLLIRNDSEGSVGGRVGIDYYSQDESTETTKRPELEVVPFYVSTTDSIGLADNKTFRWIESKTDTFSMSDNGVSKPIIVATDSFSLLERKISKKTWGGWQTKNTASWSYQDKN